MSVRYPCPAVLPAAGPRGPEQEQAGNLSGGPRLRPICGVAQRKHFTTGTTFFFYQSCHCVGERQPESRGAPPHVWLPHAHLHVLHFQLPQFQAPQFLCT